MKFKELINKSYKGILCLTLFFLLWQTGYSQSLLYKVTGDKLANPVYIFGTIHALPQSDFFMDEVVMKKFEKADKIVFEIDMASPTMMAEVQGAMMMQGKSIDQLISEEEYKRLRQFFADSLQLPLDFLKQVKPLLMSSFMLPKLIGQQPASYEGYFLQKAMELGKPIFGIETVAEQIGYIDKIPLDQQVKMLMESVDDFTKSRAEYRNLVETYKTRDVEKVYAIMMETAEEYKEFGKYLIDKRNQNWIPRIIEIGNQGVCFVAVGCGHLGGEMGVLNLFRIQGFEVTPVGI